MEFRCLTAALGEPGALLEAWQGDTLAVGLFSDPDHPTRGPGASLLGPGLDELLERRRFKGKPGETVSLQRLEGRPAAVILVGLGDPASFDTNALRAAAASSARAAAAAGSRSLALALPVGGLEPGAATSWRASSTPAQSPSMDRRAASLPSGSPSRVTSSGTGWGSGSLRKRWSA